MRNKTSRQAERDREINNYTKRMIDRQTRLRRAEQGRAETDRETDIERDRETVRETDRQRERERMT